MKTSFFLLCFLVANRVVVAQPTIPPSAADSLKKALSDAKSDTSKVLVLESLTHCYTSIDLDSALAFGRQGIDLAYKGGFIEGRIRCSLATAYVLVRNNEYMDALQLFFTAKQLSERFELPEYTATAVTNIADIYIRTKDMDKARLYLNEAQELQKKYSYSEKDNPISFLQGNWYQAISKSDSAIYFFKKAYQAGIEYTIPAYLTSATYYIGEAFARVGKLDSALYYYQKSSALSHQYDSKYTMARAYQGTAEIFMRRNQLDSTILYANKALEAQKSDAFSLVTITRASSLLSQVYEKKNMPWKALDYFKQAAAAGDSIRRIDNLKQNEKLKFEEAERESRTQRRIEANRNAFLDQALIYALSGIVVVILIIALILNRNNRQKQRANILLQEQKNEIDAEKAKVETTLLDLKVTQAQLIQAEKMASLGELTAGIAHEIQNPLNFVNNYSEVNAELIEEIKGELQKGNYAEIGLILDDLEDNENKIHHHGQRADAIVRGMLQHSRANSGTKEPTNLNELADEYLRLAYHGLRAKDSSFEAEYATDFDENLPLVEVVQQDIGRALLNIISNAYQAVAERKQIEPTGYQPKVKVGTRKIGPRIELTVQDNGNGIPEAIRDKIFQPFFTTKPTGQGTGLGLSLAYESVKAHGGTLTVESREGQGTEFLITLPLT